eukprot:6210724-Pleurochrysis_carterae.AAC.2
MRADWRLRMPSELASVFKREAFSYRLRLVHNTAPGVTNFSADLVQEETIEIFVITPTATIIVAAVPGEAVGSFDCSKGHASRLSYRYASLWALSAVHYIISDTKTP